MRIPRPPRRHPDGQPVHAKAAHPPCRAASQPARLPSLSPKLSLDPLRDSAGTLAALETHREYWRRTKSPSHRRLRTRLALHPHRTLLWADGIRKWADASAQFGRCADAIRTLCGCIRTRDIASAQPPLNCVNWQGLGKIFVNSVRMHPHGCRICTADAPAAERCIADL